MKQLGKYFNNKEEKELKKRKNLERIEWKEEEKEAKKPALEEKV